MSDKTKYLEMLKADKKYIADELRKAQAELKTLEEKVERLKKASEDIGGVTVRVEIGKTCVFKNP